jgi:hypothetical protein
MTLEVNLKISDLCYFLIGCGFYCLSLLLCGLGELPDILACNCKSINRLPCSAWMRSTSFLFFFLSGDHNYIIHYFLSMR